ncbi:CYTH domain-containing protein [Metabacillus rhizolycopersici]|uniref:CYTH domain-containing protein n=1 Tax=Metabacillus rhizolycopersici TaxID=2875709 RepID=A0ABS7UU82_9BACI|nr:CYTH domain-containing protein [Metabacillus rhizolycopersici]MBZ5751880.1 CYTH domain-containing protein [Metabacillus rhizolycopersici]
MSQEIEIEFKNLLTEAEFLKIKAAFQIEDNEFILQENHYFDTPQFSLKELEAALRIRKKLEHFVMTLKEPAKVGLLETHQMITEEVASEMIKTGKLVKGQIVERLFHLGVDANKMTYFGTLATIRAEKKYRNGLLVLDHSNYLTVEDYELEYEVQNEVEGKMDFQTLLNELDIPIRHTKNKVRRFYEQKYEEMG